MVSFCFPHVVEVSAFSMFSVLRALVMVFCMCLLYVSLGSKVKPSIFGCLVVGSVVSLSVILSCLLYCAGSGVISVTVVFVSFSCSWFVCVHMCMSFKYCSNCVFAVSVFVCVLDAVMSSA